MRLAILTGPLLALLLIPGTGLAYSQAYEEALRLFYEEDYAAAQVQLKSALEQDPENLPARTLAGRTALAMGDARAALEEMARAEAGGADPAVLVVVRATAWVLLGQYDRVINQIDPLTYDDLIRNDLLVLRARAHLARRELDSAEADLLAVTYSVPMHTAAQLELGRLYIARGNLERARAHAQQLLERFPDVADVWYLAGEANRLANRITQALPNYSQALRLNPRHLNARFARAGILLDTEKYEQAQADIDAALAQNPRHPSGTYLRAVLLTAQGELDEARVALAEAAASVQNRNSADLQEDAATTLLAGDIHYAQGNFDTAYAYLSRYMRLFPRHAQTRKKVAGMMIRRDETAEAIAILKPTLDMIPDDAEAHALMGNALMRLGNTDAALRSYYRASVLAPENVSIATELGVAELDAGRRGGLGRLEQVLTRAPDNRDARSTVILHLMKNGQLRRALRHAETLVERHPEEAFSHNMLGGVLSRLNESERARKHFQLAQRLAPDDIEALLNLAELDRTLGNEKAGRLRLEKALDERPTDTRLMQELAGYAERAGDLFSAERYLAKAVTINGNDAELALTLAAMYIRAELPRKAEEVMAEAASRFPENRQVIELLGTAQLASKRITQARETFRQLASLSEPDGPAMLAAARLQLTARDPGGARLTLEAATLADPGYEQAHVELVALRLSLAQDREAYAHADRLRKTQPDLALGHRLAGDVFAHRGKLYEALAAYRKALSIDDNPATAIALFRAQSELGDAKLALQELEPLAKRNRDDPALNRALANAYAQAGLPGKAINIYDKLLQDEGESAELLNSLASMYQQLDDPRAYDIALKARRLAPNNAEVLDTLGLILTIQGRYQEALPLLREAHSRAAQEPRVRYHLAKTLAGLKRYREARLELRNALASSRRFDERDEARKLLTELTGLN